MRTKTCISILLLFSSLLGAQSQADPSTPLHRQYATQQRLRQLQSINPTLREDMAAIERFTTDFRYFGQTDSSTVALVFHLLPLPAGATPIATADIQAQLHRLSLDFLAPEHPYQGQSYQHPALLVDASGAINGTEADQQAYLSVADKLEGFASRAANPTIRFCSPALDPSGQATTGIINISGTAQVWNTDDDALFQSAKGGSDPWDTRFYCNVWVARLPDGVAGFAQLPGGPAASDGVVIDDRYFARATTDSSNPFAAGKTLTHLLGSYLNLYELWNEYAPCADDYVEDTPIHNASNFGLPDYQYRQVSTCEGNPVEMLSNLMDNAIDSIQYLFTWGQVMRMQATLAPGGPRARLRSTALACANGHLQNPDMESTDRENTTATPAANNALRLRVFPNPSTGQFTVEMETGEAIERAELLVANALGTTLYRQSTPLQAGANRFPIQAAKDWKSGVYVVTVVTRGRTVSEKVLLEW